MKEIVRKLSSRKLWAAIAGIIVGVVTAFGGEAETVEAVAGSMTAAITAVVYILAEAGVDISRKDGGNNGDDKA